MFVKNFVDIFWKFCRYFLEILSIFFEKFVDIFKKILSIFSKNFVDIFKKFCRYFQKYFVDIFVPTPVPVQQQKTVAITKNYTYQNVSHII